MKKLAAVLFVFFTIIGLTCVSGFAATVEFNKDNIKNGIVAIKYTTTDTSKKAKVLVQFGEKKYQYNIKNSTSFVNFPLQLGNGSYTVGVFEQIEGTKYAQVATTTVNLLMDDNSKVFTESFQLVNFSEKMNTVTLAKKLTESKTSSEDKIDVCYEYMVQQFSYDYVKMKNVAYDYIPVIDDVLKKKLGICYDYSAVFASMLRSQGVKCKLMMGYTKNVKEYHAWNEVYLNDKWIVVDTTFDSQMYANRVKYQFEKTSADYQPTYEY